MQPFSFVVFSEQEEFGEEARRRIQATGLARVTSVVVEPTQLLEALKSESPQAVFVDLGYAPHEILDMLEGLPGWMGCRPRWGIFCQPSGRRSRRAPAC